MGPSPQLVWPSRQSLKQIKSGEEIKENESLVATQILTVLLDENVSVFHEVELNV